MGQRGHRKSRGLYFFLWKKEQKSSIGNRIFVHHRTASAVKRVLFFSDMASYIVLRGCWCNVIFLNVND